MLRERGLDLMKNGGFGRNKNAIDFFVYVLTLLHENVGGGGKLDEIHNWKF